MGFNSGFKGLKKRYHKYSVGCGFGLGLVNSVAMRLAGRQAGRQAGRLSCLGLFMVFCRSWRRGSLVGIVTRLRSGRSSGRDSFPGRDKIFFLQNVHAGSCAHPASCPALLLGGEAAGA